MDVEKTAMVLEAYTRDVGRGVARIDTGLMIELGLSAGDIVEIKGKRTTAVRCLPGLTHQQLESERIQHALAREKLYKTKVEEKNINVTKFDWTDEPSPKHIVMIPVTAAGRTIRIDGLVRNNAGVAIGNTVTLRKITPPHAEKITVVPLESIPAIDERYLADALEAIPVTKGDNVMVPYFGGRLTFQVTDIVPNVVSIVNQTTVFSITSQGPTLRTIGDFKYYADGKKITLVLEDAVRKEAQEDYLILRIHLHHGGFGAIGAFQLKLEKNSVIQDLVLKYKELAQQIIEMSNKKLGESSNVDSADLVNDVKFEILEKWRRYPDS